MADEFGRQLLTTEQREENRQRAFEAFKAQWLMLIWNDECLKAEDLLDYAPAVIAEGPEVAALRVFTDAHLRHAHSWEVYRRCYDSLPSEVYNPYAYDSNEHRSVARMQAVRAWARNIPVDGPTLRVLNVGPQDCTLDCDLLTMNPRFHITMSEVCSHGRPVMEALHAAVPGRVTLHEPHDYYDWPEGPFDAILFLEVIEHLPSQETALLELRRRLAPGGVVLLSTPVSGYWGNDKIHDRPWWMHLHCNSAPTLIRKLERAGFDGELSKLEDGQYFWAVLRAAA